MLSKARISGFQNFNTMNDTAKADQRGSEFHFRQGKAAKLKSCESQRIGTSDIPFFKIELLSKREPYEI